MYYDNSHYCIECTGWGCRRCNNTGVDRFPLSRTVNNATPPSISNISGRTLQYAVIEPSPHTGRNPYGFIGFYYSIGAFYNPRKENWVWLSDTDKELKKQIEKKSYDTKKKTTPSIPTPRRQNGPSYGFDQPSMEKRTNKKHSEKPPQGT